MSDVVFVTNAEVVPAQLPKPPIDKIILKFFADVLYIKGIVCFEEYDAIMDSKTSLCLDNIVENMLCETYNPLKRGEVDGI